jgi:hypothetical protein
MSSNALAAIVILVGIAVVVAVEQFAVNWRVSTTTGALMPFAVAAALSLIIKFRRL